MICDLCHRPVDPPFYFTEYYDPEGKRRLLTYCCAACQSRICRTIEKMKVIA